MDVQNQILRAMCSDKPMGFEESEALLGVYRNEVLKDAKYHATEGAHELWTALGGDHIASRTVNVLLREFGRTPDVEDLCRRRYDLRDIRTIGAASLARIDKLINEETTS